MRPTWQSLTERFAIPERGMMKRNEPESENEAEKADWAVLHVSRLPLWVFLLASCSRASPRDSMPSTLRLPRPRCGLAMTRNWDGFVWKTNVFGRIQAFPARINVPFSLKTCQICHCEEGAILRPTRQSLTERFSIPERSTAKPVQGYTVGGCIMDDMRQHISLRRRLKGIAKPRLCNNMAAERYRQSKRPRGSNESWGRFCVSKKPSRQAFLPQNIPIFVSLRGRRAAVAILKVKAWHPVAKRGSTKQEEIPITKNRRFAASFRARFPYF